MKNLPNNPNLIRSNLFNAFIVLLGCIFSSLTGLAQPPMAYTPPTGENPFVSAQESFELLMANPDTSLTKRKKEAQRWMAYIYPNLELENNELTSKVFVDALRSSYAASCQSDPANWESDGPNDMPDWTLSGRPQTSGGWVDAVYNHPTFTNTLLLGTRTSGIMKSTNFGQNWISVTDNLPFPVLGAKQLVGAPGNPDHILALTGTEFISGRLIYSTDRGESWFEPSQTLPEFNWVDFHPTISGLVFGVSRDEVWYSSDSGVNWASLGVPPAYDSMHKTFNKILVLEDKIFFVCRFNYDWQSELYQGDFTVASGSVSIQFSGNIAESIFGYNDNLTTWLIDFSNKVGDRLFVQTRRRQLQISGNTQTATWKNYTFRTLDGGNSFDQVNFQEVVSSSNTGEPSLSPSFIGVYGKNEIIASITNPDIYYWGSLAQMRRYNVASGTGTLINGTVPPGVNGNHDDYRCSQILTVNGQERLVFGNDGGIGVVNDGLATGASITGLNGDLSINLIHAFDIHPRTGKTVFGFQDHLMVDREVGNIYSNRYIGEGSFALIQQHEPESIVGENGFGGGILDKSTSTNKIVSNQNNPNSPGTLAAGRCFLGGYQTHYRHHPERFIRGLSRAGANGGVAINRAKLMSEIVQILESNGNIGPTAICERNIDVIYVGEHDRNDDDKVLYKSTDDGLTWSDLSQNPVSTGPSAGLDLWQIAAWKGIRALAVDHNDSELMYVGLGGTYIQQEMPFPATYRVLKSINGGTTFEDYSEGLPALPIERLLAIDSDNDLIFCGTSVGVFYRTNTMSQWECFSNNLPKVMITGMKFDYCNKVLYVSTYGRGLWKTPVDFPITNSSALEINEDELWDEHRIIHENVLVKAGNTLTITSRVEIATMKAIMVEQNATLIVDGGHLTNFCNSAWRGVEVWGTTDEHQFESFGVYHQGRAVFKNGAKIENAWQGVMNWKPGDWNSIGGIIQAENSTFLNNRIDAIFMSYQNRFPYSLLQLPDLSFFKECHFTINNNHFDDGNILTPRPRITLWKTDRVLIQACNFTNQQAVDASEKRGHAIYSHDANYIIREKCIVGASPCPEAFKTYNTFTGWHKGIEALETESSRPISVRNSIFDKNMIGIELGGADYSEIYANEFLIGGHPYDYEQEPALEDENHLGLYSNGTQHFAIEQNEFIKPVTGAPYDAHGVLIESSEGAENEVYNNEFTRLKTGANAYQINRNTSYEGGAQVGHSGLQFKCNTNDQNEVDFEVSRSLGDDPNDYINAGIRLRQGDFEPSLAAGNSFSAPNPNPLVYSHWTLDSHNPYFYHTTPAESPDANEIGPDQMAIQPGENNNCPTNFTTGFTGSGGITELLIKKDEFEGLLYTYNQLIDNGNTPGTITEIELTWPQQAWQLRDQLMAVSPYNSEEVLMTAIQHNIMPHAMLLEVLLANPDALRSGQVIQFAANVPNPPMPSYMIDLLWAARDQTTLRTSMESTMADLHADVQRIQKRILINRAFADSTASMPDSTLYYLSLVKTVEGNYSRAAALADRKLYSQSISLIDSMQLSYKLTNARYAEMTALKNLYGLLGAAHSSGKTIANLDSTSILSLKNIAENPNAGVATQKAQNALCFHYSICYDAQGQPKSNGGAKKPKPTYEELLSKLNTNTAYPNPTDQYVTIAYTFLHAKEESTLLIFDNLGRQVELRNLGEVYEGQQLIDTRKLSNGVYPYQIVQDGQKVSEGKIVVTH